MDRPQRIAIIGAAGQLGSGLAFRLARAGHRLVLGSRTPQRAAEAAAALRMRVAEADVQAMDNIAAAAAADWIVVTVPFAAQRETLESIRAAVQGKLVIDATVALQPPKVGTVQLPPEGCAGVISAQTLGEQVRLVTALQNVPAKELAEDHPIDCDVLVCGEDRDTKGAVIGLLETIGLRGLDAGGIRNAAAAEAMTSVLITLGRRYKVQPAIRITGL
ncbi:MAG: NADPH-dependent F420 reductase [Gammaproteobacteria bacterium]